MTIKIRSKRMGDYTLIRTLIAHPMETGRNRHRETGTLLPARFIQELTLEHNGQIITTIQTGPGVSRNPYFSFHMQGGSPGDEISVHWIDNTGKTDKQTHILK